MSDSTSLLVGPVPTFQRKITGYRSVDTVVGDTLERIAARELGDAAQWYDIVQLNRLVWPYLVTDPRQAGAGLKVAGRDQLLVPSVAPAATGVAQAPSVFGTDCLLKGRQLQASPGGDFATISEAANLTQAIGMRLATHPGDLVYHPTFGCRAHTLLGKGGTPAADQLAAAFVAAAINADPRISRAAHTIASTTGDVLAASSTAVAVNGKRLPVGVGTGAP